MMAQDGEEASEKEHEPSQRRLEDARKKGDVAKSNDLAAAAAQGGFLLAGALGVSTIFGLAQSLRGTLAYSAEIAQGSFGLGAVDLRDELFWKALAFLALFAIPACLSLLALLAQRGLVFAPERLRPKLERVSPIAVARQKFGVDGLTEFAKSVIKLFLVGAMLAAFLTLSLSNIVGAQSLDPRVGLQFMIRLLVKFLLLTTLIATAIGIVDYFLQHFSLMRRNRMSRKELQDETKESDGDPYAKSIRRQRGQEIALNQMLAEVPKATVVIVNPTHYAIALRWKQGDRSAPVLVAKGVDEVAARIRSTAQAANVPIHSDPPTARSIYALVKIGHPIDREHFKAVAAAIRFANHFRQRSARRAR